MSSFYEHFFKLGNRIACVDDYALRWAAKNEHRLAIKYLVEQNTIILKSEFYNNIDLDGVVKIYNKHLCSLLPEPSKSIQTIKPVNIAQFGSIKSSEISIGKI